MVFFGYLATELETIRETKMSASLTLGRNFFRSDVIARSGMVTLWFLWEEFLSVHTFTRPLKTLLKMPALLLLDRTI